MRTRRGAKWFVAAAVSVLMGCQGGDSSEGPALRPEIRLEASKSDAVAGDKITLTWVAYDAKRCEASGAWSGSRATSGSEVFSPTTPSAEFRLSCANSTGMTESAVTVRVAPHLYVPIGLPMDVVTSLNNRGDVAGAIRSPAAGTWEHRPAAVIDGQYILTAPVGYYVADATDINDSGQVLMQKGDLYTAGTVVKLTGLASAYGITEDGRVVGSMLVDGAASCCVYHAALFAGGALIDLGTLGGVQSAARAVNESGIVVGRSELSALNAGVAHAARWNDGGTTDLGTLGGISSEARAINERGEIVGRADTADGDSRAFIYREGSMRDLGTLGGRFGDAQGINDASDVVGTAAQSDGTVRSFLYREGTMYDLNRYLATPLGIDYPLTEALDINNRGQIVARACWRIPGCPVGNRCDVCSAYLLDPTPPQ